MMIYLETEANLFSLDRRKYILGHCISKDCAMGAGIATQFIKEFPGMKEYCKSQHPMIGQAILYTSETGWVYNLITKDK